MPHTAQPFRCLFKPLQCVGLSLLCCLLTTIAMAETSPWVRPLKPGDPLLWGRRDGIVFGLPSTGGLPGPRGLVRIGVMRSDDGQPQLLNYVAVEPVTRGPGNRYDRMAFSELEMSALDPGKQGKRLSVHERAGDGDAAQAFPSSGTLQTIRTRDGESIERLSVRIDVEKFTANGAHVYLVASIDSDQPEEVRFAVFAESDSPPVEELTVTATMGNFERLRLLWLGDKIVFSHRLFPHYTGDAFAEGESYPLSEMLRTREGDAVVYCTTNEADPQQTRVKASAHWQYPLPKLTQYWRVPGYDVEPDLRVRVNARRVYWNSHAPVPGGIAFENFETRQRFVPGQTFIFGISRKAPPAIDPRLLRKAPAAP